jgi:hypothetical protein
MKKTEGEKLWKESKNLDPANWVERLRSYAIPYYFLPIKRELVKKMLKGYNEATFKDLCKEVKEFIQFDKHINIDPDSLVNPENFFLKVNMTAPKDSMNKDHTGKCLPFFSFEKAFEAVLKSEMCLKELEVTSSISKSGFVIKPVYPVTPDQEWRVYIREGGLWGMSQYYASRTSANMSDEYAHASAQKILAVLSELISYVKEKSFVADFICTPTSTVLVDLNVYGVSDPLLFPDYESMAGRLLYNIQTEE